MQQPTSRSSRESLPFFVAMIGTGTLALQDVVMKYLAVAMGAYNAMLWRVLGTVVIAGIYYFYRRSPWPTSAAMRLHVRRALVNAVMAYLFFWGLVYVPLAEAIALTFIAPLIAMYLAATLLGERVPLMAYAASMLGFVGVIVIMLGKVGQQHHEQFWWGVVAVLTSAALYAYTLILQRQQAILAKPAEIAFVQGFVILLLYGALAPALAVVPKPSEWLNIGLAAALTFGSVLLLSWAYARAEARILIPVEYTGFIWAALAGWLLFNESLTLSTLAGTALIIIGSILAARS